MNKKKVIIVGGGFGGLRAAKSLKNANVEILLIDKTNHHLFQPLLYQVATAALSPGDIAVPIRAELKDQQNCTVIMGEVIKIDREKKIVYLSDQQFEFDYLILAIGARHSYFGNDEWEKLAPGLKTIGDALAIREKILLSFEKAERYFDSPDREKYLTFVIVGGGPTGVEMAGAIAEIAKRTLLKDFRRIHPEEAKVILVEGLDRILTPYDKSLSEKAANTMRNMGVELRLNSFVKNVTEEGAYVGDELIKTENIIWAAGNHASKLTTTLNTGTDKAGRVKVNNDCSIAEDENIFVIGDAALFIDENGKPLPGVAPVAEQQGRYVANIIKNNLGAGKRNTFKYFDKGSMATIGRAKAVMQVRNFKASGLFAWLAWSLVHIALLINFRKRYKVMIEWIYYYLSFRNGIRLIWKNDGLKK